MITADAKILVQTPARVIEEIDNRLRVLPRDHREARQLRGERERWALELDEIRRQHIAHARRMRRLHAELAAEHHRRLVELLRKRRLTMGEWVEDDIQSLTDYAFMKIYRSPYHHNPGLKARLDQEALGTGYAPNTAGARSGAARIVGERDRRGLTYPQSWIDAGLMNAGE